MTIADKLLQLNQVKQDIKTAIENKDVDLTGVDFGGYAEKIDEIQTGGGDIPYDEYALVFYYRLGWLAAFANAWESSLAVDPEEISEDSGFSSQRGTAQYPNGEKEGVIIPNSVTTIGDYAFYNWSANNRPLVIPDSVTSIGTYAFGYWTTNKRSLVIPDSVTSIGQYAFRNWYSNNQPLVIPNSVTDIGVGVFQDWGANNQPLVIPDSVTSIGNDAFSNWKANTQPLVIPNNVTSIGNRAFRNWDSAKEFIMESETPPTITSNSFQNTNNAPIYVPNESVDDYKTATNWVDLASRIFSINDK